MHAVKCLESIFEKKQSIRKGSLHGTRGQTAENRVASWTKCDGVAPCKGWDIPGRGVAQGKVHSPLALRAAFT